MNQCRICSKPIEHQGICPECSYFIAECCNHEDEIIALKAELNMLKHKMKALEERMTELAYKLQACKS